MEAVPNAARAERLRFVNSKISEVMEEGLGDDVRLYLIQSDEPGEWAVRIADPWDRRAFTVTSSIDEVVVRRAILVTNVEGVNGQRQEHRALLVKDASIYTHVAEDGSKAAVITNRPVGPGDDQPPQGAEQRRGPTFAILLTSPNGEGLVVDFVMQVAEAGAPEA